MGGAQGVSYEVLKGESFLVEALQATLIGSGFTACTPPTMTASITMMTVGSFLANRPSVSIPVSFCHHPRVLSFDGPSRMVGGGDAPGPGLGRDAVGIHAEAGVWVPDAIGMPSCRGWGSEPSHDAYPGQPVIHSVPRVGTDGAPLTSDRQGDGPTQ
jgi:hypothetical protein